ncbi:MAG: cobalamin B12-binding domain-containing protein [Actinomycetota bacterium]|nr:cobalamin B12-binding domain-containing protein [Actinomycetota bacterium]
MNDDSNKTVKKILGATIGSCIHVAGILNFLNLASRYGYKTKFLGSACSIDRLKEEFESFNPDIVAVSYRLSPESALPLFEELKEKLAGRLKEKKIELILGCTKPVGEVGRKLGIFDAIFTGEESIEDIESYLSKKKISAGSSIPPDNLLERIKYKKPFPLIRHHFGRPTLAETIEGIKKIASSGLLDVISIGPDQNTQEFFFHPEKMNKSQDGAGGVPLRSVEDFRSLYEASRTGNYPLMRCYSGTNDIIKMAEILLETIKNAWCAVPLCWYNELDNRSGRRLEESIAENQAVMKWHADRNIPVEVNESHHWSLRYSPDSVAVAAAFIAAYNAKKMGVKTYISQYMFNTPAETSFTMDLAKMLAKIELIESLHDENFTTLRQTRSGLYSYSTDFDKSRGQLASSTMLQMQVSPDIVHVVAYCEADHAAKPDDIIKSVKIANKVIDNCLYGCPDMKLDEKVRQRKEQLILDAGLIIEKIKMLDSEKEFEDPLVSPAIISRAIKKGILDAPHLYGVKAANGTIRTMFIDGMITVIDENGRPISERERLDRIKI